MVMNILRRPGVVSAPSPVITLEAETLTHTVTDPSDAYCGIAYNADGTVTISADSGSHAAWLQFALAGAYQLLAETDSGTLSVGTAGTLLDFPVTLGVSRTTEGSKTWTGTVTVKRVSDGVTVAGPTALSLTATVLPAATGGSGGGGGGDTGSTDAPPGGIGGGYVGGGLNEY